MFTRSEIIVLTKTQTNTLLKRSNDLRYATTLGKNLIIQL